MNLRYSIIGIFNLIIIAIFLILAFYSCQRYPKPVDSKDKLVYNIDLSSIEPSLENLVNTASIIPLEMSDQAVIGEIDRLIIDGNDLILFDSRVKQVLVYDKSGSHYSTIKKTGRGPSEYMFLTDIIYDKKTKKLGLLRQEDGAILWFDLVGNLEMINQIDREKFILDKANILDNQIYHFNSNSKYSPDHYQVNITDLHLNSVTNSLFKTNVNHTSIGRFYNAFGKYNDEVSLHMPHFQHLYTISSDTIWKVFEINFKENNIPEVLFNEFLMEKSFSTRQDAIEMNKKLRNYALVKQIIPLNDKMFITFTFQHQPHGILINLANSKINVFKTFFQGIPVSKLIGYQKEKNILYFNISPRFLQDISEKDLSLVRNIDDIENIIMKNDDLTNFNPWILELQL